MNDQTDSELLCAYATRRSDAAFAELVRRHVDFVYSAAMRMVRDSHLAQDVTQSVFVALAKNAGQLADRAVLTGWLHRTAQNIAAQSIRTDVRRRAREQEAAAMNQLLSDSGTGVPPVWSEIAPHLDAGLGELTESDRDALLLRYFEHKSAREMAQLLGISDEAAQKRVSRAVERLREYFTKRGVTVGAGGLTALISANAIQAAPVGLVLTISTATAAIGTTVAATTTATTAATATKAVAMTTLQKTVIGATLAAAIGAGVYEARQNSQLKEQLGTLQNQQAPLEDQIQTLETERNDLNQRLDAMRTANERLNRDIPELLRLRAEITRLRSDTRGQSQQRAHPESEFQRLMLGIDEELARRYAEQASNKLVSLKPALGLTPEQEESIRDVLFRAGTLTELEDGSVRRCSGTDLLEMNTLLPMELYLMTNTMAADRIAENLEQITQLDAGLKALLSPNQRAAYDKYKSDQASARAIQIADDVTLKLHTALELTIPQQEQINSAIQNLWLSVPEREPSSDSGHLIRDLSLKSLEGILTPAQLEQVLLWED